MGWGRRHRRTAFDDEARGVIADLTRDVGRWQLRETDWEPVREALARLADAARRRDLRSFARARGDLDLLGPDRIVAFGETPDPSKVPVPEEVRELLDELGPLVDDDRP